MAQLSTCPPSPPAVLVWEDPQASPKCAEEPNVYYRAQTPSKTHRAQKLLSGLFSCKTQLEEQNVVTLADSNHPSPTFSVETTGHLNSLRPVK